MSPGQRPARGAQRRWRIRLLAVAAAVLLAGGSAGCGGSSQGGTAGSSGAAGQPAASPSGSSIPTGTQLQALLPYHVNLPAGYKIHSVRNSGKSLEQPLGLTGESADCSDVAIPSSALDLVTNWWASSWADSISQAPGPGGFVGNSILTIVFGGFGPGLAQRQIGWYAAEAARCHSYTDDAGDRWATTATPVTGVGAQALYIRNVGTHYTQQELMVRGGRNLAVLSQSSAFGPILSQAQLQATAQAIIGRLPVS